MESGCIILARRGLELCRGGFWKTCELDRKLGISLRGREEFGLGWVEIAWDGDLGPLIDGGINQSLDGTEGLGGFLCLLLLVLAFTGVLSLDGYIPFPFFLLRCKNCMY